MPETSTDKDTFANVTGDFAPGTWPVIRGVAREGLSLLTEVTLDLGHGDPKTRPEDLLGKPLHLEFGSGSFGQRNVRGLCISVEEHVHPEGGSMYRVETRPRLWLLTLTRNSRIFQEKSVLDVIGEVLGDHGLSDYDDRTKESYPPRTYCVQYRESDFDFIARLMEEEGIYFFFDHGGAEEKLVLADGPGGHQAMPRAGELDYSHGDEFARKGSAIYEWVGQERVNTGKISLVDYDFTKPSADLSVTTAIKKGKHAHGEIEAYDTPGKYTQVGRGDGLSRVRAEAAAHVTNRAYALTDAMDLAAGDSFKLRKHAVVPDKAEFLVLEATHFIDNYPEHPDIQMPRAPGLETSLVESRPDFPQFDREPGRLHSCAMEVAPLAEPFRAPSVTPRPEIAGLQTAIVTGPSGEEIHTDEHGRVKVQFHWDRQGKKDEKTTCWVRAVVPWSGKGWGIAAIPRIGQEVVIQFEEGDPDRPICTGMLYNGANKPPYGLPANKTQTGIKTNSSKGGGGFNELMFEDKKDGELVRFQSEKDYEQIVKNNADITIGLEKKDKGDLTQTIHGSKTETLKTGDHSFTVEEGQETVKIKKDRTKTIEGKSTETVTKDTTLTVLQGNLTETINSGNATRTVKRGNDTLTTSMGNVTIKAPMGKITLEAGIEILLKVGGTSIKLNPAMIVEKAALVNIEAKSLMMIKGNMVMVNAGGMMFLRGGMIHLN